MILAVRMRRERLARGCLALVALVALVGCASGTTVRATARPAPDAAQILRMPLLTSQPLTLDPALITDSGSAMVASLIYPSLLALDSQLTARPWAAQSVEVSADGLTLTFHLRGGMRFSDGEPITAQTFAYSWNRALDPCMGAPNARLLFAIATAEAFHQETCADATTDTVAGPITTLLAIGGPITIPDPVTLTVRLGQPWMGILAALTAPVAFAVPQRLVESGGPSWTSRLTDGGGVGGGLFRLSQAPSAGTSGQAAVARLTRNPQFWGSATRLREMDLYLYPSASTAWADYQAGTLDVGFSPAAGGATRQGPLLRLAYIGVNWSAYPLGDQRLRQALALALDKQSLAASTPGALAAATNHLMPKGEPGYNAALVGPDLTQNLTGNMSQAVKLALAFASSRCGGQFSRCPPVTLDVATDESAAVATATAIARMWQAVAPGYPLDVRPEPLATLQARVASGTAQLYLGSWAPAYPDPSAWLDEPFGPGGAESDAATPDIATLLAQGESEQDPAQRAQDYQAAEQLLVSAVAWIPLYQEQVSWQTRASVTGVTLDAQGALAVYDTVPSIVLMLPSAGQ